MATEQSPAQASPAIKDKFRVVGIEPGPIVVAGFGPVDLRKISLKDAEAIHKLNCVFLEKIENPTPAAAPVKVTTAVEETDRPTSGKK